MGTGRWIFTHLFKKLHSSASRPHPIEENYLLKLFWDLLPRWRQEASRRPLDPTIMRKEKHVFAQRVVIRFYIFRSVCLSAVARFRAFVSKKGCTYFRHELYLPMFLLTIMFFLLLVHLESEDAHADLADGGGGAFGVRR